jgi:hypothetical protein
MNTKPCRVCDQTKPLTEFFRNDRSRDGFQSACKSCLSEQRLALAWAEMPPDGAPKTCRKCKQVKPRSLFPRNQKSPDGRHWHCKTCAYRDRSEYEKLHKDKISAGKKRRYWANPARVRDKRISKNHDIPIGTYDRMLADQKGVCAICGRSDNPGMTRLAIDHCHTTKKIRGLLCTCCNQAIGQLKDSPELLRRAADYLEAHFMPPLRDGSEAPV